MSKKPSPSKPSSAKGAPNPDAVEVHVGPGEDADVKAAKALTGPYITNAFAIKLFAKGTTGEILLPNIVTALREASERVQKNDMTDVEAMLTSQAMALNAMFGELSCRSAGNFDGSYFEAGERYFKMAMKAQNQCRMTLETLSTIKNPPVVYAKQANIAHGPQQVNNGSMPPARTEEIRTRQANFWSKAMKSPWTPERRARQATAIHRWKPWEKSTGPRTAESKAIVSRNAFKGGNRILLRQSMREFRQFMKETTVVIEEAKL